MGTIGNPRDYLILTNNPLVPACMEGKGLYTIDFRPELSYREILTLERADPAGFSTDRLYPAGRRHRL